MAIVKIDPTKLALNEGAVAAVATALDATDGVYIRYKGRDTKILLLLTASAAGTVVVKGGDGVQGGQDTEVSVTDSGATALVLDSGYYKLTQGEYKGYVHLTGKSTTKVQAIELP